MSRVGRWMVGALTLAGLALGVGFAGGAWAQQPLTLPMQVTENRAPGAAGQVTMTPLGTNQVRVDIRITGLRPARPMPPTSTAPRVRAVTPTPR